MLRGVGRPPRHAGPLHLLGEVEVVFGFRALVLMVASVWQWDTAFMAATLGWRACLAVLVNARAITFLLRGHLGGEDAAPRQTGAVGRQRGAPGVPGRPRRDRARPHRRRRCRPASVG